MSIRNLASSICGPAILVGLLVISLLVGCAQDRIDPCLVTADSLMDSHPDSALKVLDAYSLSPESSPADSAYYALLLTHARYKNFIDETDDSLISVAADHFLDRHDEEKASRALFLKGMIQMNANRLGDAAVSFRKGLDIAHEGKIYMWEGQCARGLVAIYSQLYDGSSQLEYAKKAYKAFANVNDNDWSEYAKLNVARAYNNNGLYWEADSVVNEIIAACKKSGTNDLLDEAYQLKGLSLYALGMFEESLWNYDKVYELNSSLLTPNDWHNINIAQSEICQQSDLQCLSLPRGQAAPSYESTDAFVLLARNGKYKEAYECLGRYKNEQDSVLSLIIKNNVAESMNQYEDARKALNQEKKRIDRMSYWIIILLFVVAACALIWKYREGMHQEQALRLQKEADLESLRADFKTQRDKFNQTSEKADEPFTSVATEDFLRIIRQQYAATDKLCDEYYQGVKSERERLDSEIDQIVTDLTKGDGFEKIKRFVDEQSGGLYSSFTKDFFDVTEDEKRLFLYQMLGFSSRTIAVIIGYETKAVYNRRSRLKAKIENSDFPKKDTYLKVIQKTTKSRKLSNN